jgi:hypothetical protein
MLQQGLNDFHGFISSDFTLAPLVKDGLDTVAFHQFASTLAMHQQTTSTTTLAMQMAPRKAMQTMNKPNILKSFLMGVEGDDQPLHDHSHLRSGCQVTIDQRQ